MIGCGVIFAALTFSASWRSLAFVRILGGIAVVLRERCHLAGVLSVWSVLSVVRVLASWMLLACAERTRTHAWRHSLRVARARYLACVLTALSVLSVLVILSVWCVLGASSAR